jgi:hypothetical protein
MGVNVVRRERNRTIRKCHPKRINASKRKEKKGK